MLQHKKEHQGRSYNDAFEAPKINATTQNYETIDIRFTQKEAARMMQNEDGSYQNEFAAILAGNF